MNLPSPYNMIPTILIAVIGLGVAFADDKGSPRVNPFELPAGIHSKGNIPKKPEKILQLEAVFKIKGQHIATISGTNFIKGDFAFGRKVLNIFDNRVLLDAGEEKEFLFLPKSNFKLQSKINK